ncbi:MAG: phytanoyl-CoA dioxygenase family protein [Lentisphaerae bacterium]|nr:phytanoyl-CoA dioxygenase family protein [Lentisphaerota bacterium]
MRRYVEDVEHVEREGYAIARGVLTDADLAPVIAELSAFIDARARQLQQAGRIQDLHEGLDFGHRVVELYRQNRSVVQGMDIMILRGRAMFDFLHNEHLLDLAEALLGPEITCNPIQHVRAKMPASVDGADGFMNVPWHQDVGVTHPDSEPSRILTFWTPLVDATRETGCMEILPRCVSLGALPHVTGNYGTEIEPSVLPTWEPVAAECRRGDVVIMNKYTPHRGTPNRSDLARWSIDLRYQVTGHHTGRLAHPDFPVRSRRNPASVQRDYPGWCKAWQAALANPQELATFHRVTKKG